MTPSPTTDARSWVRPTAIAMAIDTLGVIPIFLTAAMAVQLEADIGLAVDSLGVVYATYFGAAAALSIPVGRITERTGPGASLRVGTILTIASLLGIAAVATTPLILGALIALSGLGTSLTRTASSVLVARAVPAHHQGRSFGLKNSAIPVASLLSGAALPLIGLTVGWRWAFVLAAVLGVGVFFVIPSDVHRPARPPGDTAADLPISTLTMAAVAGGFGAASVSSLGAFSVVTAVDVGMTEAAAGGLVVFASVAGVVSRIWIGFFTDARPGGQLHIVAIMLFIGAAGLSMTAFANTTLLWIALPIAYVTGWAFFGTFYLGIVRLNPSAPGRAVGVAQAGAFGGSIVGPIVLGLLAERVSFTAAWLAASAAGAVGGTIIVIIWAFMLDRPRRPKSSPVG